MIHMTNSLKAIYVIAYATMFFAAALTFITLYWLNKPYNILEFYNMDSDNRVILERREYCAGEMINVFIDSDKKLQYPSALYSSLVNSITIPYTPVESNTATGRHIVIFTREIPKYVPEGEYYLQFHPVYQVNPIRKVDYKINTQIFYIKQCNQGATDGKAKLNLER